MYSNPSSLSSRSVKELAMQGPVNGSPRLFRIWIAGCGDWQPTAWRDVPPRALALEPAEAAPLSAAQAQAFLEGFNGYMLDQSKRLWAVAVPVVLGYDGDARAGRTPNWSPVLSDRERCRRGDHCAASITQSPSHSVRYAVPSQGFVQSPQRDRYCWKAGTVLARASSHFFASAIKRFSSDRAVSPSSTRVRRKTK